MTERSFYKIHAPIKKTRYKRALFMGAISLPNGQGDTSKMENRN